LLFIFLAIHSYAAFFFGYRHDQVCSRAQILGMGAYSDKWVQKTLANSQMDGHSPLEFISEENSLSKKNS
jgi:hypothetical protein